MRPGNARLKSMIHVSRAHLCKLSPYSAWNSQGRVRIAEEACGVRLDLLDMKTRTSVHTSSAINASLEGSLEATNAVHVLLIANWIWERNSWWTIGTLDTLVDVGSSVGG